MKANKPSSVIEVKDLKIRFKMPPGTCSLGTFLSDGFHNVLMHPYQLLPAAIMMVLIMFGSHLIAEGLKKATE